MSNHENQMISTHFHDLPKKAPNKAKRHDLSSAIEKTTARVEQIGPLDVQWQSDDACAAKAGSNLWLPFGNLT